MSKIKVLVVDDSALVRELLSKGINMDPQLEVVGKARDPFDARDQIVKFKPDVITLDVEMPKMDGVEFLRRLMRQYPLPVIMVSSLTERNSIITLQALEAGAVDFVLKPSTNISRGLNEMLEEIRVKIKMAATVDFSNFKKKMPEKPKPIEPGALARSTDKVIAIGASTGGTEALKEILSVFPAVMPGVVIVQHMPPGFTKLFSERLNSLCAMEVKEAENNDRVMPGRVLVAPGDYHMRLVRSGGLYLVKLDKEDQVSGHRPSADVLFHSVAKHAGPNSIGVILTGMGRDGADGMLAMKKAGSRNIAQDERSSVVFGMPKEAFKNGAAEELVDLRKIPERVKSLLEEI